MIRNCNKVLIVGNFTTKEINWEEMEVKENVGSWSEELMYTMMVNAKTVGE